MVGSRVFAAAIAVAIMAGPLRPPKSTIIPWAWERRELLQTLPVKEVAYLAGTFHSRGSRLELVPRMQPLIVAHRVQLDPVFRIETNAKTISAEELSAAAQQIAIAARRTNAALVQIDFDATASQRALYRQLLVSLRRVLPPQTRISITALASWCLDDRWIADLPVDEAVPMLFRMGPSAGVIRRRAAAAGFPEPRCRETVGLASDEPFTSVRGVSRIYVFHPRAWTPEAWRGVETEIRQWHN